MVLRFLRPSWRTVFLACLIVSAGLVIYAYQIEPYRIEVTHYHISAPLNSPIKIAHLTDLHTYGLGRRELRMIAILEAEKPDIIVLTGDQISATDGYEGCREVLSRLHAPLGVWVVPGNHENWHPIQKPREFYESVGATFLKNGNAKVRDDLWLIGLDDAMTGAPDLAKGLAGIPAEVYKIALFHSPAFFDEAAGKCDLALAGHTHGGQVRAPFMKPFWLPMACAPYVEGWYERLGSRMYVSRGIGTSVLPLRLNCRPEIAIITAG